ncbi:Beta-galactosidase [Trichinella pseudospiralis]
MWPGRFKLIGMRFSPGRFHFATTVDNIDLTYQNRKLPSNKLSHTPNNATPLLVNLHPATDLLIFLSTKHGRDSLTSRKIVLLSFSFRCFQAPELINSPSIVAIYLQNRRLARAWRPTDLKRLI